MTTSREVFARRKLGELDEAYQMALQLMKEPDKSEWDIKAFGWCLIDLIKRDVKAGGSENLKAYCQQLESIEVSTDDEILSKQRMYSLTLCSADGQFISKARFLSKQGEYKQAIEIYRKVASSETDNTDYHTSYGWDIYKYIKQLFSAEHKNILRIKKLLHEYLSLNTERPSQLHSSLLFIASRIANENELDMLAFLKLWDISNLRQEDYEKHVAEDGKEYDSLAEKVIRQASKSAEKSADVLSVNEFLPYLDEAIKRFIDDIWLIKSKAKIMLSLKRYEEATRYAIEFTRTKNMEFWSWEMLGDIRLASNHVTEAVACYCKALLCNGDDKFTGKLRVKLAELLVELTDFTHAKYEINRVYEHKNKEGHKIPDKIAEFRSTAWFASSGMPESNNDFYKRNVHIAESLLFDSLPWIEASIGDSFSLKNKPGKTMRKIYVKSDMGPFEVVIPEDKHNIPKLEKGAGLRVKGEFENDERFNIYQVEKRAFELKWDIFPERIGVVDQVNYKKKVIHFIVQAGVDGVIHFDELNDEYREDDGISLKLARSKTKQGVRYRALTAMKSDLFPDSSVRKEFLESVRVDKGMGFTENDIFFPPPLISKFNISNDETVSGVAVISYNQKRDSWGWRAVSIDKKEMMETNNVITD